ncbi:MAG: aminoacyl-tRNA hydrolase [Anaerolineales bacterium]|nr:aminoacyl-tRNA hydrolase [Anaerolineales bacterium]
MYSIMEPLVNSSPAFLIAGLGNPGREYKASRHNIGFMLVSHLAEELGVTFSRVQSKALVTKTEYQGSRLILAKPQTYMNLSGQAVGSLVKFYKIEFDHLLVVYDDVDLPYGRIRMRPSGGSAGQKGMRSIIDQLGTQDFPRMRFGIGRPPGSKGAASYVLRDFSGEDAEFLPSVLDRGVEAILTYIREDLTTAMNRYNSKTDDETD